jgi:hypothetical protein
MGTKWTARAKQQQLAHHWLEAVLTFDLSIVELQLSLCLVSPW